MPVPSIATDSGRSLFRLGSPGTSKFRRQRSTVVAAIGIGLLNAPWGVLLIRPPG